jgi:hypothetical protein
VRAFWRNERKGGKYVFTRLPFSSLGYRGAGGWAGQVFRLKESEDSLAHACLPPARKRLLSESNEGKEGRKEVTIGAKRNETHQIAMMMFIRLRTIYS